jgi:hypothetical protein
VTPVDLGCSIHGDLATRATVAAEELPSGVGSCLECAQRLQALRDLRDLGRSLEWTDPDAARSSLVRARILEAVASSSGPPAHRSFQRSRAARSVSWSILAVSAAAAIAAVVVVRRAKDDRVRAPSGGVVSLGAIAPVGAARYDWVSRPPDEVVRLVDGRIHVEVAHLGPAERFRIVTGDAVVEVRGTAFDVQASGARLQAVAVERGRVEVKVGPNPARLVGAGNQWVPDEAAVPAPPGAAPAPLPVAGPLRVARPVRERSERKQAAPSAETPVVVTEPPPPESAHPATLPTAEIQAGAPVAPPLEAKKAPVPLATPAAASPATATPRSESETARQEREERRAERRELREERRLEHLERRH